MAPFFLGDTEYDVYLGSVRQNIYVGSDLITGDTNPPTLVIESTDATSTTSFDLIYVVRTFGEDVLTSTIAFTTVEDDLDTTTPITNPSNVRNGAVRYTLDFQGRVQGETTYFRFVLTTTGGTVIVDGSGMPEAATGNTPWNELAWTGSRATGLNTAGTALTGGTLGNAASIAITSTETANGGASRFVSVTYAITRPDATFTPETFSVTHNVLQAAVGVATWNEAAWTGTRYTGLNSDGTSLTGGSAGNAGGRELISPETANTGTTAITKSVIYRVTRPSTAFTPSFFDLTHNVSQAAPAATDQTFTISFVDNSGSNIGLSSTADFVVNGAAGVSISGTRGLNFSSNFAFSSGAAVDDSATIATTFSDANQRIEWTGTMPATGGSATITFTGSAVERDLLDFVISWTDNTGTGLNITTTTSTIGAHPGDPLTFARQINTDTGFELGSDLTASATGTDITASVNPVGVVSITGTQPAGGGSSTVSVGGSGISTTPTFGFTISPRSSGFGLYELTEITGTATGTITYAWSVNGEVSPSSGSDETFTTSSGPSGLKTITCTATREGIEVTETTDTFIF